MCSCPNPARRSRTPRGFLCGWLWVLRTAIPLLPIHVICNLGGDATASTIRSTAPYQSAMRIRRAATQLRLVAQQPQTAKFFGEDTPDRLRYRQIADHRTNAVTEEVERDEPEGTDAYLLKPSSVELLVLAGRGVPRADNRACGRRARRCHPNGIRIGPLLRLLSRT
jgi:hypothetical protein